MSNSTDSTHKIAPTSRPSTPWSSVIAFCKYLKVSSRYIHSINPRQAFGSYLESIASPLALNPLPHSVKPPIVLHPNQSSSESYTTTFKLNLNDFDLIILESLSKLYPNHHNFEPSSTKAKTLQHKNLRVIKEILLLGNYETEPFLGTSVYEYLIFNHSTPEFNCLKELGAFPFVKPTQLKDCGQKWYFCKPSRPFPPFKLPLDSTILNPRYSSTHTSQSVYELTVDFNNFYYRQASWNDPELKFSFIKGPQDYTSEDIYNFLSTEFDSNLKYITATNLPSRNNYKKDLWRSGVHHQDFYLYPKSIANSTWMIEPVEKQPIPEHSVILVAEYKKTNFCPASVSDYQSPYPTNNNQVLVNCLSIAPIQATSEDKKAYEVINNSFNLMRCSANNSHIFTKDDALSEYQNIDFINSINYSCQSIQSNPQPSAIHIDGKYTCIPTALYDTTFNRPNSIEISFYDTNQSSSTSIRFGTYYKNSNSPTHYNINSPVFILESTNIQPTPPDFFKKYIFNNIDLLITNDTAKALTVLSRIGIKKRGSMGTALITMTEARDDYNNPNAGTSFRESSSNLQVFSPINSNNKISISLSQSPHLSLEDVHDIITSGSFNKLRKFHPLTISPIPWVCHVQNPIHFNNSFIYLSSILLDKQMSLWEFSNAI